MIQAVLLAAALNAAAAAPAVSPFAGGVPTERAPAGAAASQDAPYRTDEVSLTLDPMSDADGSELEYMVRVRPGAALVYSWTIEGPARDEEFYVDFHGHTPPGAGFKVVTYRETEGRSGHGSLVAGFEGTHGWFFQNRSMSKATVRLRLAGFYEIRSLRETVLEDGAEHLPFGPPRPVR